MLRLPPLLLALLLAPLLAAAEAKGGSPRSESPWDGAPRYEIAFPEQAGHVDVKARYGAKGDGVADDTKALQQAITENLGYHSRIVYLPTGTYLVSATLITTLKDGSRMGGLKLFGQQRERTVIRLKDDCPGFDDPTKPKPVIRFLSNPPHGDDKGNGNAGHFNSLVNLTVDTGTGNPGANGVAWLPSNIGTLRDVTIRSGDGGGPIGVDMTMAWPGPGLGRHLLVSGFAVGLRLRHHEYGMTFHGLALERQREAGVHNSGNTVHIRGLKSRNAVPAIVNTMPSGHRGGQLVLLDAELSGTGDAAIVNEGIAYLRNVRAVGYGTTMRGAASQVAELLQGEGVQQVVPSPEASLNLPIAEVPDVPWDPPSEWAVVRSASEAQAAIDRGRTTICFPYMETRFDKTIVIRGNVRRVIGMGANLWSKDGVTPTWRFEGTTAPATVIEWMASGTVEMAAPKSRALILRHMVKTRVVRNAPECGPLFIEDVCSGPWTFTAPMDVFAYQWNPECDPVNVTSVGARLWVLGWKTERPGIQFDCTGGALELLGGLAYPCQVVPADRPMFRFADAQYSLFLRYATYRPGSIHAVKVRDERKGGVVEAKEIGRGLVVGWDPGERQRLVKLMRGEEARPAAARPASPEPARPAWRKPDAAALAEWDARLAASVRAAIAARREPTFVLGAVRSEVTVAELADDGGMRIAMGGGAVSWRWDRLGLDDRARLAVALLRPFARDDAAIAAFFLLASGDLRHGVEQLGQAGEAGAAVRAALAAPAAEEAEPAVAPD